MNISSADQKPLSIYFKLKYCNNNTYISNKDSKHKAKTYCIVTIFIRTDSYQFRLMPLDDLPKKLIASFPVQIKQSIQFMHLPPLLWFYAEFSGELNSIRFNEWK